MFHVRTVFWALSLLGALALACAEETEAPAQPGASPDLSNFNGPGMVDNSVAPLIDLTSPDSPPPLLAAPGNTAVMPEDFSNGGKLGGEVARSEIVKEYEAEKFKVYPDDPDSAIWETNVRFAFSRAQREMKPLLLLFTSMENAPAMSLSQEVFATKSFNQFVKENLVICYLNYPQNIRTAPQSMQWAKREFKVAGYPSVLIFSPQGNVDRSLRGYRAGRPVDYFENLKSACAPTLFSIKEQKAALERQGFRFWRNEEGRGLFAKFVRRDDYLMTLKDAIGQEWTVAISQLKPEDRTMARSFPRLDQVIGLEAR